MKRSLLPILVIIFITIVAGCKTRKNTIEVKDQVKPGNKTTEQVLDKDLMIQWFDGKFNSDIINDGKSNSVKGRVRIRRDSLIWISIKPDIAIIEVFRVLISPDSVQLIDYLNKKYFMDKISGIKEFINYDISFQMVQNIFMGNSTFILDRSMFKSYINKEGDDIIASSDFNTYVEARGSKQSANFLFQALWFSNNVHKRNLMYDPDKKIELDLQYKEHTMVDNYLLPKTGQITVIGDSTNTRFTFDYTKILLNEPFDFPFSIPENYERMYLKK